MDNKDEQTPEEILPELDDEQDSESMIKPMAGIIISPNESEKVEPYEKLKPIGGDILPTIDDIESNPSENTDDKNEQNLENEDDVEIMPINIDTSDIKINIPKTKQAPLAGKVMPTPPKKEDEKIAPLAGEVIPLEDLPDTVNDPSRYGDILPIDTKKIDDEPPADKYVPPKHPLSGSVCGDIPPSFMRKSPPKTGFWKSLLNKFRKDNY